MGLCGCTAATVVDGAGEVAVDVEDTISSFSYRSSPATWGPSETSDYYNARQEPLTDNHVRAKSWSYNPKEHRDPSSYMM